MSPDITTSSRNYEEYVSCQLIAIPARYDYKPYAYGFQKDSPYLPIFNHYIKAMQEKGSLDQILEKYAPATQFCPDLTGKALGFNSCISAFLVLVGGAAIGLILLAIELCSRKTGLNCKWLEWYDKESDVFEDTISNTANKEDPGIHIEKVLDVKKDIHIKLFMCSVNF